MDELAEARAKLAVLEKQERELVISLCDVRQAAEAQRTKIKKLVNQLPSPIGRLPNELLLRIIELAVQATSELEYLCNHNDLHEWQTEGLMKVSRHWRNAVLHCPKLWTAIDVAPSRSNSHVKAYVKRSWPYLVDVKIHSWRSWMVDGQSKFDALFDVAALCSDRWRSISIPSMDWTCLHAAMSKVRPLILPSLRRVSMENVPASLESPDAFNPRFLIPGNSPFLEYLEIGGSYITSPSFPILPNVKAVHVHLQHHEDSEDGEPPVFLERLASYPKLTTLTFSGNADTLELLRPDSVRLPFLEKLICKAPHACALPYAIVVPKLSHFEYSPPRRGYLTDDMFSELDGKFSSVSRLVLNSRRMPYEGDTVFSTFPNVRHAELSKHDADIIFRKGLTSLTWPQLETLTINGGHYYGERIPNDDEDDDDYVPRKNDDSLVFLDGLANWLQQRRDAGQPMLRIKIASFGGESDWISNMHDALHGLCVLELTSDIMFSMYVRLMGTSSTDSTLWLVC